MPLVAFLAGAASAVNFSWNVNTSGAFNNSADWLQTSIGADADGVPDANDIVTLRRGSGIAYTVTFSGFRGSPVDYMTDRLLVGTNSVTVADALFDAASTYTVENATTAESGRGIIIGVSAGDTAAVLNSHLPTFSGAAATIGDVAGSNGILNVSAGTVNVTGSDAANLELIVGRNGTGALNVNSGADVSIAADAALGEYASAIGTASVAGTGSTWTGGGDLSVGYGGQGTFSVTGGGQASNTTGYIGKNSGSIGLATVDGVNSTWSNSNSLHVGYSGAGTLGITNGGTVTSGSATIGTVVGATGLVTVEPARRGPSPVTSIPLASIWAAPQAMGMEAPPLSTWPMRGRSRSLAGLAKSRSMFTAFPARTRQSTLRLPARL